MTTERKCSVCEKKHYASGYCRNHYEAYRRNGSPTLVHIKNKGMICKIKGCGLPAFIKGVCKKHYQRWYKHSSYEKKIYRGANHHSWKGGKSQYPNHHILKKNRLIKLKEVDNKCEDCNAYANKVIHRDDDKTNHIPENLKVICQKCWGRHIEKHGKGKYKSKYGNIRELAKKHSVSIGTIYMRLKKGILLDGSETCHTGRPKKSD